MCLKVENIVALFLVGSLAFIKILPSHEVKIGPHVSLPITYDVQVLPSVPVHVNVSLLIFEILTVDEPKQVK